MLLCIDALQAHRLVRLDPERCDVIFVIMSFDRDRKK
jgi:hypothetical protein